ncbi:TRAP transporter small permease [Marispirochaeta sp.]|uniref:TRAP transporter small permease n=1 Tax=Marispirochaeta sp. TaxID=2038653 RepID=UPI00374A7D6E
MRNSSWYKKTLLLEEIIVTFCFIVLFATILIQILFRLKPISENISYAPVWTEEFSRWLFVYIVFFGASQSAHNREHIGINIFITRFASRTQHIISFILNILMTSCSLLFVYYGIRYMKFAVRETPLTLPCSNGVLYAVVPIGFFLISIRLFFNTIDDIIKIRNSTQGDN